MYLDALDRWSRRINITGLKNQREMAVQLFLDSLIPAPYLPERGSLLDAGSGGGFPGIPLKIFRPHMEVLLLEAGVIGDSHLLG